MYSEQLFHHGLRSNTSSTYMQYQRFGLQMSPYLTIFIIPCTVCSSNTVTITLMDFSTAVYSWLKQEIRNTQDICNVHTKINKGPIHLLHTLMHSVLTPLQRPFYIRWHLQSVKLIYFNFHYKDKLDETSAFKLPQLSLLSKQAVAFPILSVS